MRRAGGCSRNSSPTRSVGEVPAEPGEGAPLALPVLGAPPTSPLKGERGRSSMPMKPSISHAALGEEFFDKVEAAKFPEHILRYRNQRAARTVGLDELTDDEWINHFGRFAPILCRAA